MTKSEGIMWLRAWREIYIPVAMRKYETLEPREHGRLKFKLGCSSGITSGMEYVWLNALVDELDSRIYCGEFDPVTEVAMYMEEMDQVLALSDPGHFITHRFASFMSAGAHDILWYLMRKEKIVMGVKPKSRKEVFREQLQKELDERGILVNAEAFMK